MARSTGDVATPATQNEHRDADGADHRDPRRAEAPDERARGRPGDQRARRERRDRDAVGGVGQAEVGLDLGIAGQQVGEHRAVGQEQRRDRHPGPAVGHLGGVRPVGAHWPTLQTTRTAAHDAVKAG